MSKLYFIILFATLGLGFQAFGQYGPMGFGNADGSEAPAGYEQPRLLLWLDGSSVTGSDGQDLTIWPDKSGNGHDFLADASWAPIFRASGGPAGRPYVEFSRAGNRMYCENFPMLPDEYTIYFVIRSNDNKYGIFSYGTASDPQEFRIHNDNGVEVNIGAASSSTNINTVDDGDWSYGGIMHDMGSLFWQHHVSGESEGTSSFAGAESLSPSGTAVIGNIQQTLNGGFLSDDALAGDVAEIIVWGEALTRPQSRLMRTYLWAKYGSDFRRNGNNGWDKFWAYSQGNGRHYSPIAVGRDDGNPNPGRHHESRSEGLALRVNPNQWTQNMTYLCAGSNGEVNSIVSNDLPSGVEARWNRTWEISGDGGGTGQQYRVAFDFGEGISGDIPQEASNYVLLRRTGTFGTFAEVTNVLEKAIVDDEVVFTIQKSNINTSNRYYTIGTKNQAVSSLDGSELRTWHAYQSGNWDDPATWTLDGSAAPVYVNPESEIPSPNDKIRIGSGRTVAVNINGINQSTLELFGTLDVGTFNAPSFSTISGNGTIRCAGNGASSNFPMGNTTAFADENNGGRVEFYGSGSNITQTTDFEVNQLEVNFSSSTRQLILGSDLTHNGFFELTRGRLVINDGANSERILTSKGDVFIGSQGSIRVNAYNRAHRWNVEGNIDNDGDVRLTQRTTPGYSSDDDQGRAILRFVNSDQNQYLNTNGNFYITRLVVDKGLDKTYKVELSANADDKFRVLGRCTDGGGSSDYETEAQNANAIAIINGTLQAKQHIFLPLQIGNGGNYNINSTAALWIDGGVAVKGAPQVGPGNSQAIVIYGEVRITDGEIYANTKSGFTLRGNGLLQVDGGTVYANQIRTSIFGSTNIGGYIQNGGDVFVNGSSDGGNEGNYYVFSLSYEGNLFQMSGGNLHVTGANGRGLIWINSDPAQTSVSGGTVHVDVSTTGGNYKITSRAPFWNLRVSRSIGAGTNRPVFTAGGDFNDNEGGGSLGDQPLRIDNSLTIEGQNNPTLRMGPDAASPQDLFVKGSMTIEPGGNYEHFSNTTHFIGNSNSFLSFQGTTSTFNNVIIDKDTDTRFAEIQSNSVPVAMDILGSLFIERGFLENNDRTIHVRGNITNRSKIGRDTDSSGDVLMNGTTGEQRIISQAGVFHGLNINNPDGVRLENDGITVKRRLALSEGVLFIGDYKLRMETSFTPFVSTNSDRFIASSGNASAGGVEVLFHSGSQNTTFPIGVADGEDLKYTPAVTVVNGSFVDSGFVRITPVDTLLSTVDISVDEPYLNYYWRVSHSDFDNLPRISHRFEFLYEDTLGTASELGSGRVLADAPFSRETDDSPTSAEAHVDVGSRYIFYNGSDVAGSSSGNGTPLINASYSAGSPNRFVGAPTVLFSRTDNIAANWTNPSAWNNYNEIGSGSPLRDYHSPTLTDSDSDSPGPGDIVYIGYNVDTDNKPHSYAAPSSGIQAAEVRFTPMEDNGGNKLPRYNGSSPSDITLLRPTLRLSSTSELGDVKQISGEGALLLQDDINLSVADVGGFLKSDSSIVIVQSGSGILQMNSLPPSLPNLFITSTNDGSDNRGVSINNNVVVRGDLEIAGNANLWLSSGAQGNITVNGDLVARKYQASIAGAQINFPEVGTPKSLIVDGDLILSDTNGKIEIFGSSSTPPPSVEWTPDELGALLWLDADDATTVSESGGFVTEWANKAGGSYNAVQSVSGQYPVYQSSGLNGKNTVRFDGVDDFLRIPHNNIFNVPANQDFELFTVITPQQKDSRAIFAKGGVHNNDLTLYYWSNNYRLRFEGATFEVSTNTGNNTDPNIGWVRREGPNGYAWNTSGGNGSTSGVASAEVSNTKDVTVGTFDEGNDGRFFDGDIAEVIFVKRALNSDEREKLEGYLAHKWGLTNELPAGHPYKDSPPTSSQDNTSSHQLEVKGDIVQDVSGALSNSGIKLYRPATYRNVNLILSGDGNNSFENSGGPAPDIWKMTVDKGFDTDASFTWDTDVNVFAPSNEAQKPVDLRNGLLVFNDSNIDITLSSGGGDYSIPGTAGLELNDGILRINSPNTGLLLDGSLEISGGLIEIGNTGDEDNYIEYSSNGSAKIEISGGMLSVGSQIRRGLTNTAGILDYRQSGGSVEVGKYAAPILNRGVFEVVNDGSRFDQTGGTLTLVRGINSSSTPSLLINPSESTVSGNAEIIIGSGESPEGAEIENVRLQINVPINRLRIDNSSGHDPRVRVQTVDLEIDDFLYVDNEASLGMNTRNLILNGDFENNGDFSNSAGTVYLNHPTVGVVSGAGSFDLYNLERQGGASGFTDVNVSLTVNNDFTNDGGDIDFDENELEVFGDVFSDGHLMFSNASNGLIFSGSEEQELDCTNSGTSYIDVLTMNNPSGVAMTTGADYTFVIDKNLRMQRGVLKLNGNLLELGVDAEIEQINAFGESNMISTGGAFTNFGVRKYFPANFQDEIVFIPLGLESYMPVILDFEDGGSSGSTPSDFLFKLNIPEHPIIQNEDIGDVLGMYFSMEANNIGSGLSMKTQFQYDESFVQVTGTNTEEDYITARVFDTDVFKNSGTIDTDNNILSFTFSNVSEAGVSGDYFGGIDEAIPDLIPEYTTTGNGNVEDAIYTPVVPGGGAPSGAIVNIVSNHNLSLDVNGISFYKTNISTDATLEVDETTFHRLGTVDGDGTIKLRGTGNLPSGTYNNFFNCNGGKLIYEGLGGTYDILANLPIVRRIDLVGNGLMRMSNNDVNICEDFTVTGPDLNLASGAELRVEGNSFIQAGTVDLRQGDFISEGNLTLAGSASLTAGNAGKTLVEGNLLIGGVDFNFGSLGRRTRVRGNVIKTAGNISGGTSGAGLVMEGETPQYIEGNFSGVNNRMRNLEIVNEAGVQLHNNVEITDSLRLTSGNLRTGIDSLIFLTNDGVNVVPQGGSAQSFIDGPMEWSLGTAGIRVFPVGSGERFRPLTLLGGRTAARTWTVEYFDTLATTNPAIQSLEPEDAIIQSISIQEHWRVNSNSGGITQAKVGLSWGENSGVADNPGDQAQLRIMGYDTGSNTWESYGGSNHTYSGGIQLGNLESEDAADFSEKYFTLGSVDEINPLPVTWLYFTGETDGNVHTLTWATSAEINNDHFILERSLDAENWRAIAEIDGAGYSNTTQYYSYNDRTAPMGRVYYRIKQVDYDFQEEYAPHVVSLMKLMSQEGPDFDFVVFPNPSQSGNVNLLVSELKGELVDFIVSDISGRVMRSETIWIDGQGISEGLNLNYTPGIYLLIVRSNDRVQSQKLIIGN